jgi:hypothetical protein
VLGGGNGRLLVKTDKSEGASVDLDIDSCSKSRKEARVSCEAGFTFTIVIFSVAYSTVHRRFEDMDFQKMESLIKRSTGAGFNKGTQISL